jgi:hypothetical protein
VSAVRFHSTYLKTLSASLAGGPPIVVGPVAATDTASGRGRQLVIKKSVGRTSPTYVHNRYIVFRYSDSNKNDIYKKKLKIK